MTTLDSHFSIEGPYRHGAKFRCRIRTADGRRWCPSAGTIDAALAAAQREAEPAATDRDPVPQQQQQERSGELDPEPQQRADTGVRVLGPYRHDGAWRCRIVSSAGRSWAQTAATEALAIRNAEKQAAVQAMQGTITIRDSIEAFLRAMGASGAQPSTLDGTRRGIQTLFAGQLDTPVGRLTTRRAQEGYDALQVWVGPRGHTKYKVLPSRV